MAFQSYCYLRLGFIIAPQQMSVSKWHQLTNYTSPRLIWHCNGSGWGLPHISVIPKPPKHFSQQQENSPFAIILPFLWNDSILLTRVIRTIEFCVCLIRIPRWGHYWCLWHCVSIAAVCIRAVKEEDVPVDKPFPILSEPIGSKRICLIDSSLWFPAFFERGWGGNHLPFSI